VSARGNRLLYPIPQMTTYELRDLREKLEETLAMPELPPYARPREKLQQDLDDVIAEEAVRERIRHAKPEPEPAEDPEPADA
jgi:hypothetical protein